MVEKEFSQGLKKDKSLDADGHFHASGRISIFVTGPGCSSVRSEIFVVQ